MISGSVDIWRLAKNTYKYGLQKTLKESPTGLITKKLSVKDTKDLYDMIVSANVELPPATLARLKKKEEKILKMHTSKVYILFNITTCIHSLYRYRTHLKR